MRYAGCLEEDELSKAESLLQRYGVSEVEFVFGRSEANWSYCLSQAKLAFHGYFSAFGTLGFSLPMSMMAAVPVVLSKNSEASCLPAALAHFIPSGVGELEAIKSVLSLSDAALESVASRARDYAIEEHGVEKVSDELLLCIEQLLREPARRAMSL